MRGKIRVRCITVKEWVVKGAAGVIYVYIFRADLIKIVNM